MTVGELILALARASHSNLDRPVQIVIPDGTQNSIGERVFSFEISVHDSMRAASIELYPVRGDGEPVDLVQVEQASRTARRKR